MEKIGRCVKCWKTIWQNEHAVITEDGLMHNECGVFSVPIYHLNRIEFADTYPMSGKHFKDVVLPQIVEAVNECGGMILAKSPGSIKLIYPDSLAERMYLKGYENELYWLVESIRPFGIRSEVISMFRKGHDRRVPETIFQGKKIVEVKVLLSGREALRFKKLK